MDYDKRYDENLGREMPNRFEKVKDVALRRNKRLLQFFSDIKNDIRLIGDPENPAIIVDNQICLSAYVHNFYLNFTDQPDQGNIVEFFKLKLGLKITQEKFDHYLEKYEHRRVYRIHYRGTNLFLSGYNFLDKEKTKGRYPVFSKYNYKLYFNKEYAQSIVKDYTEYDLVLM